MLHFNDGRFECQICGRQFSQKYQLDKHAKSTCTAQLHSILFKEEVNFTSKKVKTEIQMAKPMKKSKVKKKEVKVTAEEIKAFLKNHKKFKEK